MSAVFITSSGTGIGKTLVAAAIITQLMESGRMPLVLKPVMSGFDGDDVAACDAAVLLAAQCVEITDEAIARISPWRFAAPLSAHLAAEAEAREIDFAALCAFCRTTIVKARGTGTDLVIEGIGGAMVPLTRRVTVLDWMAVLEIPAVLVVGSYLGALSHALSTASVLATRGIRLAAVVVSESVQSVGLAATTQTLGDFLPNTRIVGIPRIDTETEAWRRVPPLADICLGA